MNREVMFSSVTDEWATPQEFFDELNKEFHFTLDPAANEENHKCETFFTKKTKRSHLFVGGAHRRNWDYPRTKSDAWQTSLG